MIGSQERAIEGLKNGDKSIFEEIYREYFAPLCYYCLKYVDSYEDSEEIVQDLFVKIWEMHDEIEINISLNAYLYKAVQNYALNHLSKQKTKEKLQLSRDKSVAVSFGTGQDNLEEEELSIVLRHAILKLPEKRREIFELSRFDGFQNLKIAERMAISVKTVETQMTKTLKYLRIVLKDYLPLGTIIVLINSVM